MVSVESPPVERAAAPAPRVKLLKTEVSRRTAWILRVASVAVPFAIWWAVSGSGIVPDRFLPAPPQVWAAFTDMVASGDLQNDLLASLGRIGAGFGLAILISVPLGFLMGTVSWAQPLFEPIIGILRYLPASAFIPLLIIWLGIGETSKIALLVLGVVFFNTLMTADVVRQVPRRLLDVSATLGAGRARVAARVVFPHSLPGILDALRVNAAVAYNLVVVAELIAATSGLGYRITRAQRFLQTDKIFAILIVIGLIGLTIDVTLRVVRARVGRWSV
ncbi:ABC transporter permease [Herbidospora sp. NBRC 101105]|uniref:ABC transporter permease n=1 Tax=Herbidospora sp. NBRC 101105 TaxID=3032195 RepID=UPI0024A01498|nr:ABC transporter permease [Herbidospora sp. NBRC 101105]GLX94320.1 ABC transporter permease [Herbidospora sp. NBRC 101105]